MKAIGFYGNGELVDVEVPYLMFTEDHVPHWSIHWKQQFNRTIPEGAVYLSNRPLTEAESAYALTINKAI